MTRAMQMQTSPSKKADGAGSAWRPFQYTTFTVLWAATVLSNIGSWMQNAAAGWLMTSLSPEPFTVALVQAATTLPMFLFSLPAGALADIVDRTVATYSGGQRRRLEIGRALVSRPKVLFLDEPTVGLDPTARRVVWERLEILREEAGTTLLVTTHQMEEAERRSSPFADLGQTSAGTG